MQRKQSKKHSGRGEAAFSKCTVPQRSTCVSGVTNSPTAFPSVKIQAVTAKVVFRDKELAAVKLKKEDIDLIMTEYEVERKLAERRLREHSGNLRAALESFL